MNLRTLSLVLLVMAALVAVPGMADEECLSQCDAKSDKCMADTNGDEKKEKACDDEYTKCLKQCE